jgi:endo-1,3(4)-beta-glucanase
MKFLTHFLTFILFSVVVLMSQETATTATPFATQDTPFRSVVHPAPPSAFVATNLTNKPLPTNTWWQNAILQTGNQPIFPYPYALILNSVRGSTFGATVSLANKQATNDFVATFFNPGMMFQSSATLNAHRLIQYSDLSATFQFSTTNNAGSLTLPIVRGSPYITAIYQNIAPVIATINAILNVNGMTTPGTITNVRKLKLSLNNGQTFLIYSNRNATWQWSVNGITTSTAVTSNWVIRMAVLVGSTSTMTTQNEGILDTYSNKYAIGGTVTRSVNRTSNAAIVEFQFSTEGTGNLLLMALPHHAERLTAPANIPLQYDCIKGNMTAVIGDYWKAAFPLLPVSFSAARPIAPWIQSKLRKSLLVDMNSIYIQPNLDSYNFGKLAAKLGRLILIADELNEVTIASSKREQLAKVLEPWLNGTTANAFVYDRTWGGVLTTNGHRDSGADYGNGVYNDHHFHYGYFIYAIASLLKCHCYENFYAQYKSAILALVRDYANPSILDPKFPVLRHVDAYDGHSWASGLVEFGDGRNQESSSESINAYYALALLGQATDNQQLQDLGQILTSVETYSVNKYWHMTSASSVYPSVYAANKCVGMVWNQKVVNAVWFASGSLYVHGINFLPVTPITEAYLPEAWVREAYPYLESTYRNSLPAPTDEWKSLIYASLAVIDPIQAYTLVSSLNAFDNGNTLTNMLYWIGTRPSLAQYSIGFEEKPSSSFHSDWSVGCTNHIGIAVIKPSQYVNLNDVNDVGSNRLPTIGSTPSITFETWFMINEFNGYWPRIFDFGQGQARSNIILSLKENLNRLAFTVYNASGQSNNISPSNTISLNTWIHVAIVMERTNHISGNTLYNSQTKFYLNGVLVASGTTYYPENVQRPNSYIGRSNWNTDGMFIGKVDYLSIYPYALSAAQVNTLYKAC